LAAEGYILELKANDKRTIHSAFIRFSGLLYEIGLSPRQNEVLAVKIEIDTNPPAGAGLATSIVRRHITLQLHHHDPASLLAGKLHAILQRSYTKGRDLYDLLWYLSDPNWPPPNLTLLNNALRQTGWSGDLLGEKNWRAALRKQLQAISWERIGDDVRPFIEHGADPGLITRENVMSLLRD
jgi:hypothetical protein